MRLVDDSMQLFFTKSQTSVVMASHLNFPTLESEFKRLVEEHKTSPETLRSMAHWKLGDLYRTHSRPEAEEQYGLALKYLGQVAPTGRHAREVTLNLGAYLKQSGRLAEAEEVLTVWLAQVSSLNQWDRRTAEALREVARLLLEGFRATEAEELLQQALRVSDHLHSPDSALATEALGMLYLNFNRDDEARKCYMHTLFTLGSTPMAPSALLCKKNISSICESRLNFEQSEMFLAKSNFKARSFNSALREFYLLVHYSLTTLAASPRFLRSTNTDIEVVEETLFGTQRLIYPPSCIFLRCLPFLNPTAIVISWMRRTLPSKS